MAASASVVSGYRPIATRNIGVAPPSTIVPINVGSHTTVEEQHEPPPFGFSAFEHYGPSEVLLEDFSRVMRADAVYPLDPLPSKLDASAAQNLHAFLVQFTPAAPMKLKHPTRLLVCGKEHEFDGFLLLSPHAVVMPTIQFLCGGQAVSATLQPAEVPACLIESADERIALHEVQKQLYADLLGDDGMELIPKTTAPSDTLAAGDLEEGELMDDAVEDGEVMEPEGTPRHLHCLPLFRVTTRQGQSSMGDGPEDVANEESMDEAGDLSEVGPSSFPVAASTSSYLTPREIAGAICAPRETVLEWLTSLRLRPSGQATATTSCSADTRPVSQGYTQSEGVHLRIGRLPKAVTVEQLQDHFGPFGMISGSAVIHGTQSGHCEGTSGVGGTNLTPCASLRLVDWASAVEVLSTTHKLAADAPPVNVSIEGAGDAPWEESAVNAISGALDDTGMHVDADVEAELCAQRCGAWGQMTASAEKRWELRVRRRLEGSLVSRPAPMAVGDSAPTPERLWRVDEIDVAQYAATAATASSPIACLPGHRPHAPPWQPPMRHRTYIETEVRATMAAEYTQPRDPSAGTSEVGACTRALSSVLLLPSECRLVPWKSDVSVQALSLTLVASQLEWFARAHKLQAALNLHFVDLNLLRRAFVHPSYVDQAEAASSAVGQALTRAGTQSAQGGAARVLGTLRVTGRRQLLKRMQQAPLARDEVLSAPVEYHNQRVELLGDAVIEFIVTHHAFRLFPSAAEGYLTDVRTSMINNSTLAHAAVRLGLHTFALVGTTSTWAKPLDGAARVKTLADTFEAFIGAVYLDRGLGACRVLLAQVLFPHRADLPIRRVWLASVKAPYEPAEPLVRDGDDEEQAALHAFEASIACRFTHLGLLRQAFTHPSYATHRTGQASAAHNQRLEHLGDAVLQLAATEYLFHHFPEHQEGQLSMLRASLVNNSLICDVACVTGMHHCMRFHHVGLATPGRARRGMLADAFEAFIGALFLDRQPLGMAYVKAFAESTLFRRTARTIQDRRWMDPKMRLQVVLSEFNSLTGKHLSKTFRLIDEWGPHHERMYLVGCYINGVLVSEARGQSFSDGQMGAAMRAAKELCFDELQGLGVGAVDFVEPRLER